MRRIAAIVIVSLFSVVGFAGATLAADTDVASGFELLKAKNYDEALQVFNKAARDNPDSVEAHFGRAQALEALNRREESVKEFELCLLMKPPQAIKEVCDRELDYMTLRKTKTPQMPTVTSQDVEKTGTVITNQAAERIRALQSDYFRRQAGVRPPRFRHRFPSVYPPTYAPMLPPYAMRPGKFRPSYLDSDWYKRSMALRESADGLRREMSTKPSDYADIYLSPAGTNLYVRNYVPIEPSKRAEPIQPLLAKPLSFSDTKASPTKKK